jgi:molybdopterin molybdotransferase
MTIFQSIETAVCGCDAPEHLATLITIDEALARIAQHALPVAGTEAVPLAQALGRVSD